MTTDIVYFIRSDVPAIKIGYTANLEQRMKSLRTIVPGNLSTIGFVAGSRDLELFVHKCLKRHRINGEWFEDCETVNNLIHSVLDEGVESVGFVPKKFEERELTEADEYVAKAQGLADLLWAHSFVDSDLVKHDRANQICDHYGLSRGLIWGLKYRPPKSIAAHDYFNLACACRDLETTATAELREAFSTARAIADDFEENIKPRILGAADWLARQETEEEDA